MAQPVQKGEIFRIARYSWVNVARQLVVRCSSGIGLKGGS
jgi:hypothetical protein